MSAERISRARDATKRAENHVGAMTPVVHRVVSRRRETNDVVTIELQPLSSTPLSFRPGQFNMLSAFGIGEAAISLSGAPSDQGPLRHTVRDVGPVSHALCESDVGDLIGVRGPFGTDWRIGKRPEFEGALGGADTIVVAGGIGLAPLRGAVQELVAASREGGGRVFVLVGARDPSQIVFNDDLRAWADNGAYVDLTVDRASSNWGGRVGLVTTLLGRAPFDPANSRALICGPEIMMRFTARALVDMGLDPREILVSLERNMECGLGWCGHCQLGPFLLCRDGPVLPYAGIVSELMTERER
jgi:NAD(P)H-flavin reductase